MDKYDPELLSFQFLKCPCLKHVLRMSVIVKRPVSKISGDTKEVV